MFNRTVVITGGTSGIGLATALHFAGRGWRIGLIGRGREALAAARDRVAAAAAVTHAVVADVSESDELGRAAAELEDVLGPVDVWINNAGIGFYGLFPDVPEAAFRRVIEVNLIGAANGTRAALTHMRPRNRGTIIQIGSAIAFRGVPLQTAYSATKFALRGFTEAVRAELLGEGSAVHVTIVHPPAVNTPFYSHAGSVMEKAPRPPPPVYQPELIAEAIYRAATIRRREWQVGGTTAFFRVANLLAPALLDRLAGATGRFAQQTRRRAVVEARDPGVFSPAQRPASSHGPFEDLSRSSSLQWWLQKNPPARLAFGLLALVLVRAAARRL